MPEPLTLKLVRFCERERAAWLRSAARCLDPAERDQLGLITDPDLRVQHAVGRALIRLTAASLSGGQPGEVVITVSAAGKPRVLDPPGLNLSVSHCTGVVVLASCGVAPVGVDVQPITDRGRARVMAERRFAPSEASWLGSLPEAELAGCFTGAWTIKEAVGKALGVGVAPALAGVVVEPRPEGLALASVWAGPAADQWTLHQLQAPGGSEMLAVAVAAPAVPLGELQQLTLKDFPHRSRSSPLPAGARADMRSAP